jgi:hypothetical protein
MNVIDAGTACRIDRLRRRLSRTSPNLALSKFQANRGI